MSPHNIWEHNQLISLFDHTPVQHFYHTDYAASCRDIIGFFIIIKYLIYPILEVVIIAKTFPARIRQTDRCSFHFLFKKIQCLFF